MCSGRGRRTFTSGIRGFPIRRSTDRSLFASSPWLIAGYNVLHRLLVPRHPPIALSSLLIIKTTKMLASTVKFSRYGRYQNLYPEVKIGGPQKVRKRPFRTQQRALGRFPDHLLSTPRRVVLTMVQDIGLMVNVPHSVACSAKNVRLGSEHWTKHHNGCLPWAP